MPGESCQVKGFAEERMLSPVCSTQALPSGEQAGIIPPNGAVDSIRVAVSLGLAGFFMHFFRWQSLLFPPDVPSPSSCVALPCSGCGCAWAGACALLETTCLSSSAAGRKASYPGVALLPAASAKAASVRDFSAWYRQSSVPAVCAVRTVAPASSCFTDPLRLAEAWRAAGETRLLAVAVEILTRGVVSHG